jgi:hypothetical protein
MRLYLLYAVRSIHQSLDKNIAKGVRSCEVMAQTLNLSWRGVPLIVKVWTSTSPAPRLHIIILSITITITITV